MKRKCIAGIAAMALIFSSFTVSDVHADENATANPVSIATLDYVYTDSSDVEVDEADATVSDLNKTKYGSKKDGYAFTTGSAKLFASVKGGEDYKGLEWCKDENDAGVDEITAVYTYGDAKEVAPIMAATSKNPWTKDTTPYFEIQLNAKDYKSITFSAFVGATKKGPRDYQLSYAAGDAAEFTKIDNSAIFLTKNKFLTEITGTLPSAADNQENVRIRIELASMETVSSTADTPVYLYDNPSSGEAAINHISIKGISTSAAPTETPQVTAAPTGAPTAVPTEAPQVTAAPTGAPTGAPTAVPTEAPQVTAAPATVPTASPVISAAPTATTNAASSSTPAATIAPAVSVTTDSSTAVKTSVKKLKLSKKKVALKKGKKTTLKVSFTATGISKKAVKKALVWTSSKKKVATVSNKGVVKAKKAGKTVITVKYGKKKATCKVVVK